MPKLEWLEAKHPVYECNLERWRTNERRLNGGEEILGELKRFDWEFPSGQGVFAGQSGRDMIPVGASADEIDRLNHYDKRLNEATYINFPDMFATIMVGHLMEEAPTPGDSLNFGTLGDVPRQRNVKDISFAELVYYNVDGVGNDGSQWNNFWAGVVKRAMATGHRWIYVDAPRMDGRTKADVLAGARPYLVEFSPTQVINWHYEHGQLMWCNVVVPSRNPVLIDGKLQGNDSQEYNLVMVRQNYLGLGIEHAGGGWWLYDADGNIKDTGTWEVSDGEIPMFPYYYERKSTTNPKRPSMSRPAITELGNVAVSYMNLSSAADFDAWDAASSIQWLVGVDEEAFKLAMTKLKQGSRFIPLGVNMMSENAPSVIDGSMGSVVAEVFQQRLNTKRQEARDLAALESTASPETSGVSKRAGFAEAKGPRLALIASELEQAQNTAIHFLEKRFGGAGTVPQGSVSWPRNFALMDLVDKIQTVFAIERLSGYRSKTVGSKAMLAVAKSKGIISSDEDEKKVKAEYEEAAEKLTTAILEGAVKVPDVGEGGLGSLTPGDDPAMTGANGRINSPNVA